MGISHEDIRMFFVAEVLNNPDAYRDFFVADEINAPNMIDWAATMAKDGAWVDGVAVKAAANCLNMAIVVFRKHNPDQLPTVFLPPVSDSEEQNPICVELDEKDAGAEHYNPLVKFLAVAAPLRKRLTGKQSPPNKKELCLDSLGGEGKSVSPSLKCNEESLKQSLHDESLEYGVVEAVVANVHQPDTVLEDTIPAVVKAAASIPGVIHEAEDEIAMDAEDEIVGDESPVEAEHEIPMEAEEEIHDDKIPVEAEASIIMEAEEEIHGDKIPVEAEASIAMEAEKPIPARRLKKKKKRMDAEASILVEAEESIIELPTRRLKKRRRKMIPAVEVEAVDANVHHELDAFLDDMTSAAKEAEASILGDALASIVEEGEALGPGRRLKKKKKKSKKMAPVVAEEQAACLPCGDACFVQGTIMNIEEQGRCAKCNSVVERSKAKVSGKSKTCWICKICNTKATQLFRIFGTWPTKQFKTLSAENQTKFFEGIKDIHDKKDLKMHTNNFFRTTFEEKKGTRDNIKYLPLGAWETRGFDVKLIKQNCQDHQLHPVLGLLYGIEMTEKWLSNEETQVRGEEHIVSDQKQPQIPIKTSAPSSRNPEERKAAFEAIRVQKALATQEARKASKNMSGCQKFLRRTTKLSFNLGKALSPKFVKKLPEKTQKQLEEIKANLAKTTKAFRLPIQMSMHVMT